jgi:hypothetical protein
VAGSILRFQTTNTYNLSVTTVTVVTTQCLILAGEPMEFWNTTDQDVCTGVDRWLLVSKFLPAQGFGIYEDPTTKAHLYVRNDNNILDIYREYDIQRFLYDYFTERNRNDIKRALFEEEGKPYKKWNLAFLPRHNLRFLQDTSETCYLYFQNGIARVTKDGAQLLPYAEVEQLGVIWSKQILPHEITIDPNLGEGDFERFCQNACKVQADDKARWRLDKRSYDSLITSYGYLLSGYKNPANPKIVVYVDRLNVNRETLEGGTGKSLVMRSLEHLKTIAVNDGKSVFFNERFQFANVNLDTQVVLFDDVQSSFNIEKLFSKATGSFEVERKGMDKFVIPADRSPKLGITSNHPILGNGASFTRRQHIVQFGPYYNHNFGCQRSPAEEFGKPLFSDKWTNKDWNQFYNFAFRCISEYLQNGLLEGDIEHYEINKLIQEIGSEDISDWFEHWIKNESRQYLPKGIPAPVFRDQFFRQNPGADKRQWAPSELRRCLKKVVQQLGYRFNPSKDGKRIQRRYQGYPTEFYVVVDPNGKTPTKPEAVEETVAAPRPNDSDLTDWFKQNMERSLNGSSNA